MIGAGALGSPVAAYLAGAGVGRLGILDDATVSAKDLHRQHLHFAPDHGVPKAHSAAAKLTYLNPEIVVEPYNVRFGADNAEGLLLDADLVIDCSNDPATEEIVNRSCCAAGRSFVAAAYGQRSGRVFSFVPGAGGCLVCAGQAGQGFTDVEDAPPDQPTWLGPLAGTVGSLQALVALDVLAHGRDSAWRGWTRIDLVEPGLYRQRLQPRSDCPYCG